MSKVSAISWLEQEFIKLESTIGVHGIMYEIIEQAKEMEKQQIIDAVDIGFEEGCKFPEDIKLHNAEQYYNETFK